MIPKATLEAIEKAKKVLEDVPRGAEDALRLSFNRALTRGRTVATNAVYERAPFPGSKGAVKRDIRKTFRLYRATKKDLTAELVSRGKRLPLHLFEHDPNVDDTTGKKRARVSVQTSKQSMRHSLERGFIYKGRIFERVGRKRKPIQMQFGPAVPQFIKESDRKTIMSEMALTVDKRLEHETKRLLDKHNTKKG